MFFIKRQHMSLQQAKIFEGLNLFIPGSDTSFINKTQPLRKMNPLWFPLKIRQPSLLISYNNNSKLGCCVFNQKFNLKNSV